MVAKRIIPALDIKEGRVVKCVRFLNPRDAGDPVDLARLYDAEGADEIVFLDITASHEKRSIMLDVARRVAEEVFIPFTVGGGIRKVEEMREILKTGADKIFINTSAVQNPDLISEGADRFGAQCIVVAIDAKRKEDGDYEVYIHGGRTPTGIDAIKWAEDAQRRGAGEILLTSMDADGTQAGYELTITSRIADAVPIPVIASGGAGTLEHLYEGVTTGKAEAALVASLVHYNIHTIREMKEYLRDRNVPVRL
ncbi:MAG: imidazoleglycerol phosphate synthase, cyclase subunit [Armatimonadetes bacterium]|jgi:cyclase|nr:imidazoleglycerol phosphate synthase, cyclase subunit [Armatimonadota bacterium]